MANDSVHIEHSIRCVIMHDGNTISNMTTTTSKPFNKSRSAYFPSLLKTAVALLLITVGVAAMAQQALPYNYGFENNNLAAAGWTTYSIGTANSGEFGISTDAQHNSVYGFRFSSYYRDNSGYDQYLFSPQLNGTTGVIMTFWYKASSTYGTETFKVGYSTTNTTPSSFTWFEELSTNSTTWTQSREYSFPEGTRYVAIYYYSDYQYRLFVDDFEFSAPTCPPPTNLTVAENPNSAVVSWSGAGSSYDIEWAEYSYTPSSNALWLKYDDGTNVSSVGNTTVYEWTWGVMYPSAMLQGNSWLNKVAFYETDVYSQGDPITIKIYNGGTTAPGTLLYTQEVSCLGVVGFHEVALAEPVNINPSQNLWITLTSSTITFPQAMCNVDESNGRWELYNGNWIDVGSNLADVAGYSYMIRGFIDNTSPSLVWHSQTGVPVALHHQWS